MSQYTCACPTGIKLNPDGKTCSKSEPCLGGGRGEGEEREGEGEGGEVEEVRKEEMGGFGKERGKGEL